MSAASFLELSRPPELAGLDAGQQFADGVIRIPVSAASHIGTPIA
jgi:hypothetical protein